MSESRKRPPSPKEPLSVEKTLQSSRKSESDGPLTSARDVACRALALLLLTDEQHAQVKDRSPAFISAFEKAYNRLNNFDKALTIATNTGFLPGGSQAIFLEQSIQFALLQDQLEQAQTRAATERAQRKQERAQRKRAQERAAAERAQRKRAQERAAAERAQRKRAQERAAAERARRKQAEERAATAEQNEKELFAICGQSTKTRVFRSANIYRTSYKTWMESQTLAIPSIDVAFKEFIVQLADAELSTGEIDAKKLALCEAAVSLFCDMFIDKNPNSNTQEAVTQRFWTSLLRAVQWFLREGGNETLHVHDTSTASFVGSNEQPDISLAPPGISCMSFTLVQKVVELKKGGQRNDAVSQVISRARDLRLLKALRSYDMECAVADDTAIDFHRCVLSPDGPKVHLVSSVDLLTDGWTSLFLITAALLLNKLTSGEQQEAPRESGRLGVTNVVATLQRMPGKPTVTLEREGEGSGHVVKKEYPLTLEGAYTQEVTNLNAVRNAMRSKNIEYPEPEFDEANRTITLRFIGHRVRIHTVAQVLKAHEQLSSQLDAVHAAGIWHGDISPRNIVMVPKKGMVDPCSQQQSLREIILQEMDGKAIRTPGFTMTDLLKTVSQRWKGRPFLLREVNYYLIDWGEAEMVKSDVKQGRAITLHCSYPLPKDTSVDAYKQRDVFALNCSLIMLYTESAKLGDGWKWTVGYNPQRNKVEWVKQYLEKRKKVLGEIASSADDNPFPKSLRDWASDCNSILERHENLVTTAVEEFAVGRDNIG